MKQLHLICILVVLAQPALSKPWFWTAPVPSSGEPNQQEPAVQQQQQQQQQQQELAPIKEPQQQQQQQQEAEDDLLFLSDDEVVHNKKVLKKLKLLNPKDADELIDNNPILEALILKRLEEKLAKESLFPIKKVYGYPGVVHHQTTNHHQQHELNHASSISQKPIQQQQQEYLEDLDAEQDEHEEQDHVVYDKKKYDSWKEKLKSKAGKIFKLGPGFKEKYWALRKKYKKQEHPAPVPVAAAAAAAAPAAAKVKVVDKEAHTHKIPKFYVVEASH